MRILALDISKNAPGFALLENDKRIDSGTIKTPQESLGVLNYPYNILEGCEVVAKLCFNKVLETKPHIVVVEQINLGRNRNTQRVLDWLNCLFAQKMRWQPYELKYMSSSTWRKIGGVFLTKEDKSKNAKLSRLKRSGRRKEALELGLRGKINKKHKSVLQANSIFNLNLKMKNNDEADALLLCLATYRAIINKQDVFCNGKDF